MNPQKNIDMRVAVTTIIVYIVILFSSSFELYADNDTPRVHRIYGAILDSDTRQYLNADVRIDIMNSDSIIINTINSKGYYDSGYGKSTFYHNITIPIETNQKNVILKFSNPDYKTSYIKIQLDKPEVSAGEIKLRKLSKFEKEYNLQEVVVTASILEFVNKGDTVVYNADAFTLSQGAMLQNLISKLPGAEINSQGQIYVDGKFVEKLKLNGKDFFKNNRLVLLQNMPAYAVKDIKMYEEASTATEVIGRKSNNSQDPDRLVMDVYLKKEYLSSWMGNVEGGGGTNDRYRGRGFVTGEKSGVRMGAYAFINNINETRSPGNGGDWKPSDTNDGITKSNGGGLDYLYSGKSKKFEVNGDAFYSHTDNTNNSYRTQQNFHTGFNNSYAMAWNDNTARNLKISTNHTFRLKPENSRKYSSYLEINLNYDDSKNNSSLLEDTYNINPFDRSKNYGGLLHDALTEHPGFVSRYDYYGKTSEKELKLKWNFSNTVSINGNALSLMANGQYLNADENNSNRYSLNTNNSSEYMVNKNPANRHFYQYWVGLRYSWQINDKWSFNPTYGFSHMYQKKANTWYASDPQIFQTFDGNTLPSVAESHLMFDRQNSYDFGWFSTHHYISADISYYKSKFVNGKEYSRFTFFINPAMDYYSRHLEFDGIVRQTVKKEYPYVESTIGFEWYMHKMMPSIKFDYSINSSAPDLINYVDVMFDYDPMNMRKGNPNLRRGITHHFHGNYIARKWYFKRFYITSYFDVYLRHNMMAMSYSYNPANGARTWKPVNVNGNRNASITVNTAFILDRKRKLRLNNKVTFSPARSVDMLYSDDFKSSALNIVNSFTVSEAAKLEYTIKKNNLVALDFSLDNRSASSNTSNLKNISIQKYSYGVRGNFILLWDTEFSTDLKMYSNRGFETHEMNDNQLVWNARISKRFSKPGITIGVEGYDILGNVKSISYSVNAQSRIEKWVNSIPHYVMFTLRWDFSKK